MGFVKINITLPIVYCVSKICFSEDFSFEEMEVMNIVKDCFFNAYVIPKLKPFVKS